MSRGLYAIDMAESIKLGREALESMAALSLPSGDGPAPSVVIIHEYWGLNDEVRAQADRFAREGFVALAVDLYGGVVTIDPSEAARLSSEMKTEDAIRIIGLAVDFLKNHARANGKVAVTGFCLGGGQAIAAVCNVPGIDAAVPFYGTPPDRFIDFTKTRSPILGHYASKDAYIDRARVEGIAERARGAGVPFELHFYEAGHAFMRIGDASTYDAEAATLAWSRTTSFLHEKLG